MLRQIVALSLLALAVLPPAAPAVSPYAPIDWNMGLGGRPQRYSRADSFGPGAADVLWQGGRPALFGEQAVIDGDLVVAARAHDLGDPLHGTLIVADDVHSGAERWTADLPVDFPGTDWRNRVSAMRDGHVYASRSGSCSNSAYLYALDVISGTVAWRSDDLITECSTEGASFAPDGDLIIGDFNHLARIDSATGDTVWRVTRTCPTSDGCAAAVSGNKAVIWEAAAGGRLELTLFDLATGARLYSSTPVDGGPIQQIVPFVGPDGTIYAPRSSNTTIQPSGGWPRPALLDLDRVDTSLDFLIAYRDTGTALTETWRLPLGYVPFASFGVGPDGSVYSYSRSAELQRLDPATGAEITHTAPIPFDVVFMPRIAIDVSGLIYLSNGGNPNGVLYSFNADLTPRWQTVIPSLNLGGPAVSRDGIVVVAGTQVTAFRPRSVPKIFMPIVRGGQ